MLNPSDYPRMQNQLNNLYLKRSLLKLIGAQFHIHAAGTQQELYLAIQKGFKLKEDIRISANGQEVIGIFARQIIDFSAAYDIVDLTQPQPMRIGVLKRKGWKSSFVRDEWVVFDGNEVQIGELHEDSVMLGLVRRFLSNLVPQNYDLMIGDVKAVDLRQNFNPFSYHLNIDFLLPEAQFDRRIGLAAAVLIAAIEGKQRN